MKGKGSVGVVIFLLIFFALCSSPSTAIASRSLTSAAGKQHVHVYVEFQKKRRLDHVDVEDYSGTGANNHHDPRSPPSSF
ncbi:UNVERIFIED_CONTAM: hypothetical protein Sindi_0500600 [Sesamum indicum]